MGALCLFHCQGLPSSLRDCEVDSGDAVREIRSKSRLFHWGFTTTNISFAQQKFKDLYHTGGDPVSQDSLTSASGIADNCNKISKNSDQL